jgi:hypothetical protein
LLERRLAHTILHEFLHALGLSDNLIGQPYRSLMYYPTDAEIQEYGQFNLADGLDYDVQALRYAYDDTFGTTFQTLLKLPFRVRRPEGDFK